MSPNDAPLCIDARMIGKKGTGVTTYGTALIAAARTIGRPDMLLCAENDADGRLRKWCGALADNHALWERPPVEAHAPARMVGRDIFRRAHVHFTLRRRFVHLNPPRPFGVMHWTYPVPMRMTGWINIYTVHDLIPILQPHLSPMNRARHRAVLHEIVAHADRIVTVSETARSHIVALPGINAAMVANCGQGVDIPPAEMDVPLPPGLRDGNYFLFCGIIEPRKNLARLIEAHERSGTQMPLVIAGPEGWRAGPIKTAIDQASNVMWIGFVDRKLLLALMRRARALLFPSLDEGFGLPVIEAMRIGTPVLTSSTGALAEVACDAALLVNPFNIEAIAKGIARLSKDDVLLAELSRRGRVRADEFSLTRFAARLRSVYDDAIAAYGRADQVRYCPAVVIDREAW